MYLLFGDVKWWEAYVETVKSIDSHLSRGDWFIDVDTYSGQPRRQRFENLMAFWPGVQVNKNQGVCASYLLVIVHISFLTSILKISATLLL